MRKQTLFQLLNYIGKDKKYVAVSFLCALLSVLSSLYLPICIGEGIDVILGYQAVDFDRVSEILMKMGGVLLVQVTSVYLMNRMNSKITYQLSYRLRKQAIQHIYECPLSYLDQKSQGDLMNRIIVDVETLSEGVLMGFTQFFTGILSIFLTLFFMLALDMRIGLMVLLVTPVSLLMASFISRKSHVLFLKQSQKRGALNGFVNERITAHKVSIAYDHQEKNNEEFNTLSNELNDLSVKAIFYSSLTNPCTRFVNAIVYALVALIGSFSVLSGGFSIGQLTVFLNYANSYTKPFNEITSVLSEIQNSLACASRVFEFMDSPLEKLSGTLSVQEVSGNIEFRNVCFSYVKNQKLIEDFSLNVKQGQKIAIVGPTGCGKTTLINLLMRFYEVDSGEILLEGLPYTSWDVCALRKQFGMVLQDSWIKHATIRENITLFQSVPEDVLIEACHKTKAWSFIERFSEGLDTILDDVSTTLSMGEKQLLCITRVMVANPKILILDEATSNIDTLSELEVQKAFYELMKGRTSFIVAHRLSTIQNADLILVMKDGKIIEKGNHAELLGNQGFYKQIYDSQFDNQIN